MPSEHYLRIELTDGEFVEVTPNNSALFTHAGGTENAQYDHVYIVVDEEDPDQGGLYVFRYHHAFGAIKKHLIKNKFPLHLNMPSVSDGDKEAFESALFREELFELDDPDLAVPSDWVDKFSSE